MIIQKLKSKHDIALKIGYSLLKNDANLTTNYKLLGASHCCDNKSSYL